MHVTECTPLKVCSENLGVCIPGETSRPGPCSLVSWALNMIVLVTGQQDASSTPKKKHQGEGGAPPWTMHSSGVDLYQQEIEPRHQGSEQAGPLLNFK